MIRHLLFDLDDTLYPTAAGMMHEISARMNAFMIERVGIAPSDVERARKDYWDRYGTTLRGLYIERHIDAQAFLNYVHDVRVENYLRRDERLGAMLAQLPQTKYIFTNAPADYAHHVLATLGIEKYFARIFDINFIEYQSKPTPIAYTKVLAALAVPATECLLVDDTTRNLAPARELGMKTVLVKGSPHGLSNDGADAVIETIYDLLEVVNRYTRIHVDK